MKIEIKNIFKSFNNIPILHNVSLDVTQGELVALIGSSGSGKTTLLRIIAGLEQPDEGTIFINNKNILTTALKDRGIGFVFQNYALFKHMTIFDNVAFGLNAQKNKLTLSREELRDRTFTLLKLVELEDYHNRYPTELSGGQQQRVSLARALAINPKVLLLDEPFGALDQRVRKDLRRWLRKLHYDIDLTSIFITHDQEEAIEIADKLAIMNKGRIVQSGKPKEVYNYPKNFFVYDFLGNYNAFQGSVDTQGVAHINELHKASLKRPINIKKHKILDIFKGIIPSFSKTLNKCNSNIFNIIPNEAHSAQIFARPHHMVIIKELRHHSAIPVKVIFINDASSLVKIDLEKQDGSLIQAELTHNEFNNLAIKENDEVYVYPKETKFFRDNI